VSGDKNSQVFLAPQNIQTPPLKDVKRMAENLANLLKTIVEIVQNHSERLTLLEQGESAEDSDDATLMEEVNALLVELQPE
jgi:phosphate uptake regulator